jgi:hypothetical protein
VPAVLKLTAALIAQVAADVERGCFAATAAARNGVSQHSVFLRSERGKRECEQREEANARGESGDTPETMFEQFHTALKQAKAD